MRSILFLALVACGTSTSNPDGGDTQGDPDSGPFTLSSLDDICDGAVSGKQLMALVHPFYGGTYTPPVSRPPMMAWTGSTKPSALSITAAHGTGAIVCHPKEVFHCPPGAPCAAPRQAYITVDLDLGFKTADGTLDEKLVVTAQFEQNNPSVSFTGDLPAAKIAGTYPIATGVPAETRLSVGGVFQNDGCTGSISEMTTKVSFDGGQWTSKSVQPDAGSDASGD